MPVLGDLGRDVSRCCDDTRSPLRFGGVIVPGSTGTIVNGSCSGTGKLGRAFGEVSVLVERRGVVILVSVG